MTHGYLTLTNSSLIGWWISFIFHTWLIQTIALGKKFFFIHFLPLGCPSKKKFNFLSNSLILIKFGSKLDWCYPKIWFTPITSGVDVWMRQLILRRFGANSLHMISQEYTGINKKFGIRFFLAKGWGRRWSPPPNVSFWTHRPVFIKFGTIAPHIYRNGLVPNTEYPKFQFHLVGTLFARENRDWVRASGPLDLI